MNFVTKTYQIKDRMSHLGQTPSLLPLKRARSSQVHLPPYWSSGLLHLVPFAIQESLPADFPS